MHSPTETEVESFSLFPLNKSDPSAIAPSMFLLSRKAIATAGESIIWFALAAIALSLSLCFGWVKAFNSN